MASTSDSITVTDTRTNLVPNPSFEVNLDGWTTYTTSGSVTHSRVTTQFLFGSACYQIVASAPSDAGLQKEVTLSAGTYAFSAYCKTGADVTDAHIVIRKNTDFIPLVNGHITNENQDWQRVSGVFTLTESTSCDILLGLGSYGSASEGTAWFDGVLLENLNHVSSYFDGSTGAWTGTPHNSTSTLTTVNLEMQTDYSRNANFTYYLGQNLFLILGSPQFPKWGVSTRPTNPRRHEYGYNQELRQLELWNGDYWVKFEITP